MEFDPQFPVHSKLKTALAVIAYVLILQPILVLPHTDMVFHRSGSKPNKEVLPLQHGTVENTIHDTGEPK